MLDKGAGLATTLQHALYGSSLQDVGISYVGTFSIQTIDIQTMIKGFCHPSELLWGKTSQLWQHGSFGVLDMAVPI